MEMSDEWNTVLSPCYFVLKILVNMFISIKNYSKRILSHVHIRKYEL